MEEGETLGAQTYITNVWHGMEWCGLLWYVGVVPTWTRITCTELLMVSSRQCFPLFAFQVEASSLAHRVHTSIQLVNGWLADSFLGS